jgi:PIN domain nuclease of toxin-antitoxin system
VTVLLDRLLVCQASELGVPIMTADNAFHDYSVELIEATV